MAIYALGDLEPQIDPTAYVHPLAVVIGNVELGPEASVWPYAVLRGDDGVIRIGARSNVQDSAVIHCTPSHPTIVGDGVTIGHQAHLEGCTVLDGSLIGVGAVVMPDARIGPNALVGANATVTSGTLVSAQAMALGTPARIRENAVDPDHNQRNAEIYAQRGHHYRAEQRRID